MITEITTDQGIHVAVGTSHHAVLPPLLHADICLLLTVCHLVVVVVHRVLIKHLKVGAGPDLGDFLISGVTKTLQGEGEDGGEQGEEQDLRNRDGTRPNASIVGGA